MYLSCHLENNIESFFINDTLYGIDLLFFSDTLYVIFLNSFDTSIFRSNDCLLAKYSSINQSIFLSVEFIKILSKSSLFNGRLVSLLIISMKLSLPI